MKDGDPETTCWYESTFMVKNESDQTFTECYVLVDFRTYKDGKDSLVYTTDYLREVSRFKDTFFKPNEEWKPNEVKEFTVHNLIIEGRLTSPVDSVQVIYFVKSKDKSVDELLFMDDITKEWKGGQVRVSKIYHK
jgi:hypothetical protein